MKPLVYGSVCSGIEAATVAWHPLGWQAAWYSEIEAFPCALLAHYYPEVPNLGDMTRIRSQEVIRGAAIDLLVGGTPCQSFSVAGLRAGLADPRGNLALEFLGLVDELRPRWLVWENVPGILSSNGGRDLGAFLGALGQLGYGWAYRVLDAQYFGLAQRRARVFVVGHLGDWRRAAAVLLEREGLRGDHPPRRPTRPPATRAAKGRAGSRGEQPDFLTVAGVLTGSSQRQDGLAETLVPVAGTLMANGSAGAGWRAGADEAAAGQLIPVAGTLRATDGGPDAAAALAGQLVPEPWGPPELADAIMANEARTYTNEGSMFRLRNCVPVPVDLQNGRVGGPVAGTLDTTEPSKGGGQALLEGVRVRRLTPLECERLQGFPDGYTDIPFRGKPAADGPRYKALGNSMAVPVMRWIGERIALVDAIPEATP